MLRRFLILIILGIMICTFSIGGHGVERVNQGDFAAVLAKRLSDLCLCKPPLCDGKEAKACSLALANVGIEPVGGWQLDATMIDSDIEKITKDVIEAAGNGTLGECNPPRAVEIVATTCVDLGYSGRPVYVTALGVLGYYFPPEIPGVAGAGGGVSPSR